MSLNIYPCIILDVIAKDSNANDTVADPNAHLRCSCAFMHTKLLQLHLFSLICSVTFAFPLTFYLQAWW